MRSKKLLTTHYVFGTEICTKCKRKPSPDSQERWIPLPLLIYYKVSVVWKLNPGLCICQISFATELQPLLQESQIPRWDIDMKLLCEGIHEERRLKKHYLSSYHGGYCTDYFYMNFIYPYQRLMWLALVHWWTI